MNEHFKPIEDFAVLRPQGTRNVLPGEDGVKVFRRLQVELNETVFRRPGNVFAHRMERLNCRCAECLDYYGDEL